MILLPFKTFTITTPLNPQDIELALQNDITPGNPVFSPVPYFKGYVANGRFSISPDIVGRNSFIPQVKGTIEGSLNGSTVQVKMRLFPVVIVALIFMIGFLFIAGANLLPHNATPKPTSFIPFIMGFAIYTLTIGIFNNECKKAKARLLELLNGSVS